MGINEIITNKTSMNCVHHRIIVSSIIKCSYSFLPNLTWTDWERNPQSPANPVYAYDKGKYKSVGYDE
jgi:hypothetical protein